MPRFAPCLTVELIIPNQAGRNDVGLRFFDGSPAGWARSFTGFGPKPRPVYNSSVNPTSKHEQT